MKIAFDTQPLMDKQKTGIGFCAAGLSQQIIKTHPWDSFVLPFFCLRHKEEKMTLLQPYLAPNVQLKACHWFSAGLYKMLWTFLPIPYSLFFGKQADITHFFNYHIPPGVRGKRVSTVHDMVYKAFPETVRFKTKVMLDLNLKASCRRADVIVTDSQFSKQEIVKYFPQYADKLRVVPCGVDLSRYIMLSDSAPRIQAVCQKYGISNQADGYFLYLGTLEPRKNLIRLIEAYATLRQRLTVCPLLVLAGRKGWMYDEIFATVTKLGLQEDVIFTGYVEDADAPVLLNSATAFVFPSLYEGFGMPPLEAMACGTPVLTANAASLPEVVGDAAVLVDPYSVEEICNGMFQLATDEQLRQTLREKGLARAQLFTWESAAEKLYSIYEDLMKGGDQQ